MASIWKHPRSQYFTACFRDQHGKQRRISTKETNRKRAQALADEFEKAARVKRTLKQAQAVLDRLHEELSGESIVRMSFRKYLQEWLAAKAPSTAQATMVFYRKSLGKFEGFLGARADEPLSAIRKQDVVAFRNQLALRLSARTANHDLKAVKMFFKGARRDGLISEDPSEFVETVRQRHVAAKRAFTAEELRTIVSLADPEWRSMILFGLYTGQRLGDIATLRWGNIDLARNELKLVTRKTGRSMIIPIAAPLRKELEALGPSSDPNAPVHPRAAATVQRQGKTGNLSNQFADLLAHAGLRPRTHHKGQEKGRSAKREVEPLSFHSLRRTATTWLQEAGVPLAVSQALIGHDSAEMHQHYVSVGREALAEAAAKLPDLA